MDQGDGDVRFDDDDILFKEIGDNSDSFYCKACNVTCSGPEPYRAHLEGKKHKKNETKSSGGLATNAAKNNSGKEVGPIGGNRLNVSSEGYADCASQEGSSVVQDEPETEAVGVEFMEELKETGASVNPYFCRLCSCRCTDKTTADAHTRGRRHRLQYKKTVDPTHDTDSVSQAKWKRNEDEKFRRDLMKVRQQVLWNMRAFYQSELMPKKPERVEITVEKPTAMFGAYVVNKNDAPASVEDRMIQTRHAELFPTSEELKAIEDAVDHVERALKRIADDEARERKSKGTFWTASVATKGRNLEGVVRVGPLGDTLLLRGERVVQLVLICDAEPTEYLMMEICKLLNDKFKSATAHLHAIWDREGGLLKIVSNSEPAVTVELYATSSRMRLAPDAGAPGQVDPADVLPRAKCLLPLAMARRTKLYQARCMDLDRCSMMVRIMRDICRRIPQLSPLPYWGIQLLVEKVLISAGGPLAPYEALRRIFEALASGILLPDSPGLMDPCEKELVDAVRQLSRQERDDITAYGQMAIRWIAFGKLEMVLGVQQRHGGKDKKYGDPLPDKRPRMESEAPRSLLLG